MSFVVEQPKNLGKVLGNGKAELVERPNIGGEWVAIATRMSYRYLGENGPTYLRIDDEAASLAFPDQARQL